jgi:hydroxyacylglutathione hydrolase
MADPSRLWAGTVAVYGEADATARYGEILPIAAERIVEATDDLVIDLNGRPLRVADTPGHARHHVCYFDERSRAWFTGDVFGLSYRELDRDGKAFVFPSTTPVQFDPPALHESIDRLMAAEPSAMYLTHFSRVTDLPRLAADLHRLIDAHVAIAKAGAGAIDHRHQIIRSGLSALLREEARRQQWMLDETALFDLFEVDLELNAQGLEVWLDSAA